MCDKKNQQLLGLVVLAIGMFTNASLVQSQPAPTAISNLENGKYQFCGEPKPNDWRDGVGVCLNFAKVGDRIEENLFVVSAIVPTGYYFKMLHSTSRDSTNTSSRR
jgi:hypothetical protein